MSLSTTAAYLRTWIPLINGNEIFTPFLHFILEHGKEHSIGIVHRGFTVSKTFVSDGFHVKILCTYNIIPIGYLSSCFVQCIFSLISDMFIKFLAAKPHTLGCVVRRRSLLNKQFLAILYNKYEIRLHAVLRVTASVVIIHDFLAPNLRMFAIFGILPFGRYEKSAFLPEKSIKIA